MLASLHCLCAPSGHISLRTNPCDIRVEGKCSSFDRIITFAHFGIHIFETYICTFARKCTKLSDACVPALFMRALGSHKPWLA